VAGWDDRGRFFGFDLVELGIQDVLDPLVGVNASGKGAATGSFEALLTVAAGEPEEAQAGTIGLLGVFAGGEKRLHELGGVRANGLGPTGEAVGRPLLVLLMSGRHMFGEGGVPAEGIAAPVGSDPLVVEKDLDGAFGGADVDLFVDQGVRDAVVMMLELDVVVDVDAGFLPDREFVGLLREGLEGRPIQRLEELAAGATEVFHQPRVELVE